MELNITNQREIKPYKVAVKQYESDVTTLVFTREGYMYEQVDLRRYTAYAVTSINGSVDMTELTTEIVDGNMVITWVVSEQTLRQAGVITYQIVFKENEDDGDNTAVFYTYEAVLQNSASIDSDRPIAANYPTILKQWLDLINTLTGTVSAGVVYMPVGEPTPLEERLAGRLYYQIENATTYEGHFEDNLGKTLGAPICKHIQDADINKLISHGEYICSGTIQNAPTSCDFCMVRVTDTPTTDRVIQEMYVPAADNTIRVFIRAITGYDNFGEWRELVNNKQLDTKQNENIGVANMVLVTDADGSITAHPTVSSTELNALNGFTVDNGTVQEQLDTKQNKKLGTLGNMVVLTDVDGNLMENTVIRNVDLYGIEGFDLSKGTFQTQLNNKVEQTDFETHVKANNAAIDTLNETLEVVQIASDIIEQSMVQHAENADIHVSPADREKWNTPQFPVGSLLTSVRASMEGWLLCDGTSYNTADYLELATVLGANDYTFKVPDFRGRTMWGASASQPVGSVIAAGLPNIEGTGARFSAEVFNGLGLSGAIVPASGGEGFGENGDGGGGSDAGWDFDASKSNNIYGNSDTVQPPAIAVNVFIKY